MGIESQTSSSLAQEARRLHQERVITKVHSAAEKFLEPVRIDPRNFIPPYDEKIVEKDIAYAKKMRLEFDGRANTPEKQLCNKASKGLEAMMAAGSPEWFRNKNKQDVLVRVRHTSEYDDIVNGIDLIVHFEEKGLSDYTGLAIDVTYGSRSIIEEKIAEEEEKIRKGTLSELKYFEAGDYHGQLKNVPRVIIGIDFGHVVTLGEKWLEAPESIGEDPMQILVLREIAKECEHFADVAQKEMVRLQKSAERTAEIDELIERLRKITIVYEKNQNTFLEILRSKDMNMRALATDRYPDRVSTDITNISTQGL